MDGPLLFSVDDVAYRVLGGRNYAGHVSTTWVPPTGFYADPVRPDKERPR